jgi:uncharacterized protein (TIGR02996 family)
MLPMRRFDRPDIETALIERPDDLDAWQVYADWLQTQGDPWGERVSLSLLRAQARGTAELRLSKQIAAYDEDHLDALYGKPLAELIRGGELGRVATLTAPHGPIVAATLKPPHEIWQWEGTPPGALLTALLDSPAARLLRSLSFGPFGRVWGISLQPCIDAIAEAGPLESLRELFVGDFDYDDELYNHISFVQVGDVGRLLPNLPKLRSLRIRGGGLELGALEHATLERLTIESGGLPAEAVDSLAACELPQLRRLEVWFGCEEYGGDGNVRQLDRLFAGEGLPRLEHLGLRNSEFEDEIAAALATSKILAQLESVDLSMGTMHDPGAEAIFDHMENFAHLRSLELADNFIPDALCELLREVLGDMVHTDVQDCPDRWGPDDEPHYYTSVGE